MNAGDFKNGADQNLKEDGSIRDRPLSITILGWGWFFLAIVNLIPAIVPDHVPATNDLGLPPLAVQTVEVILYAVTAFCCLKLLRGVAWARAVFTAVLAVELLRIVLLNWTDDGSFLLLEIALAALGLWALYRPASRAYFKRAGVKSGLMYQADTAICYVVITSFLLLAMFAPSVAESAGYKSIYSTLFLFFFAWAAYGTGSALGLVLNPQRHVGVMLIIAAVFQLLLVTSFEAARAAGNSAPDLNLGISAIVTTTFAALGAILIRRSRKMAPVPVPAEKRNL